jgi:3-oxoacyl-[acyl-carrier-protein] synthase III
MSPETSAVKQTAPSRPFHPAAPLPGAPPRHGPTKTTTVIESLGVYLPPRAVTTREVLRGCHGLVRLLPLEAKTGIKSRRVAGDLEFSIDLAKQAVADCLARSRYGPDDIDLLLCANISRWDGPGRVTIEPSTSLLLKHHFGFPHALAFDVLNACAGVFTALYLADALITQGVVERALVVSGEYITHLTRAAQAVIAGFSDSRLACLTLGDAGIAFILERSPREEVGFHAIDLFTMGRYSSCCIAKLTPAGSWIMDTNYREMSKAAFIPTLRHLQHVVSRTGTHAADRAHVIPHQTSRSTLRRGARALPAFLPDCSTAPNLIDNLSERGNTATTSHFVAVHDHVLNGAIQSGDRAMFTINGSGLTVGSAVYTFDDLPDRMRSRPAPAAAPPAPRPRSRPGIASPRGPRVRIESVGVLPLPTEAPGSSLELSRRAAERSLAASAHQRNAIELLLYAGVYRTDFVYEPAIAAMIAGELGINDDFDSPDGKRTFAFDVFNSSVGTLNACFLAAQLIQGQKIRTALVVAAEVENANLLGDSRRGVTETASALILDQSPGRTGFGGFCFRSFTDYRDALGCSVGGEAGVPSLTVVKHPELEAHYVECVLPVIRELLEAEGLDPADIALVIPPPLSCGSIDTLSEELKVDRDRFVHVAGGGEDLFTSCLPYALDAVRCRGLAQPGAIGLIISAGAGIEVGCAVYYF